MGLTRFTRIGEYDIWALKYVVKTLIIFETIDTYCNFEILLLTLINIKFFKIDQNLKKNFRANFN